jgi:transposase-like protein
MRRRQRALGGDDHSADAQWQADHQAFGERDLSGSDYVYVWADGIHLRIRPREAKSCVVVLMGVRTDGTKHHVSVRLLG